MRPKILGRVLAVLVLVVCAAGANQVMAQLGGSGGIQGSITDPGGAVVPILTCVTIVGVIVATVSRTEVAAVAGVMVVAIVVHAFRADRRRV